MKTTDLNSIFDVSPAPNCDVYHQFLHAVNSAARTCGLTRQGIATRMNEALKVHEVEVTETLLNKYLSPATEKYMPIHYLPALSYAVKTIEPANVLLTPIMFKALDERSQILQEHAELEVQKIELQKQQEKILEALSLPNNS